jgi:hypothetical protein
LYSFIGPLFDRTTDFVQLSLLDLLDEGKSAVEQVHKNWDRAIEREKISRTRFAQRAIKPEQVEQELVETDRALGNEKDVERFVRAACDRLNCSLIQNGRIELLPDREQSRPQKQGWLLPAPPDFLKPVLGEKSRLLTFTHPAPEGVEHIGRNHPLVEGLARHLIEEALAGIEEPIAARCGFTTTDAVEKRTTLLLVRLRHLLDSPKHQSLLAEECAVIGFTGSPSNPVWLELEQAASLLQQAEPVSDALSSIKQQGIADILQRISELEPDLQLFAQQRAHELAQSHRRVREITKEGRIQVKPQLPMDILGIYILQPGTGRTG